MCDGRRFQAVGAATEKELLESWRLNRGTIKSGVECCRYVIAYATLLCLRKWHTQYERYTTGD